MTSEFIAYIDEAGDEGFGKLKGPTRSGGQSSWLTGQASLRVVFSKRRGTNYEAMKDYLNRLSRGRDKSPRNTNWSVLDIDGIRVEDHSKRAGLQLSDCITSAFFTALEPNMYGNTETSYAERLIGKLIADVRGEAANEGLTVVPGLHAASPSEDQLRFLRRCWAG